MPTRSADQNCVSRSKWIHVPSLLHPALCFPRTAVVCVNLREWLQRHCRSRSRSVARTSHRSGCACVVGSFSDESLFHECSSILKTFLYDVIRSSSARASGRTILARFLCSSRVCLPSLPAPLSCCLSIHAMDMLSMYNTPQRQKWCTGTCNTTFSQSRAVTMFTSKAYT